MLDVTGRPDTVARMRASSPHAVVIGSGFGGLAAAIRLGARGYRVTVLEKLDQPGGRAYVHQRDGFTFDAGPTIITAPFLFEELWTLCGRKLSDDVTLRALSPFYQIRFDDGTTFDYSADPAAMEREIAKFSPDDVEGWRAFMKMSAQTCKTGFEELGHVSFEKFSTMLKIAPDLVKLGGHRSVYSTVARFIKNEKLRQVFSFHPLLIGGNPFSATSVYCLIAHLEKHWGVHFAMGGTGSLVRGMVNLLSGLGATLRLNSEVAEILIDNKQATGVRLVSGEEIAADIVVSNADSAWTYRKLVRKDARRRWTDRKLDRARYSMSLFVWYFGTRKRYDNVPHHMIMLGPRYRELLADIFSKKVLADDFSLYLHRPTATDPSLAPPGCDTFYVLSPVPNLDGDVHWPSTAERYRRAIAEHLSQTVLPGFEREIATSFMLAPPDFHTRLNSWKGAAFGLEPVLTQSAWFRPHNRSEDIERLFLVGAGTHPGAGIPGVLSSARVLDSVVPDPVKLR